ncbi:MAG: DNA mismatch repair endonuclease MutL [Paenibacillaceae bacterium]
MGIIHVLDEHIANQIAAGEVVERPSSVVKELVENAVDAKSSRIDVVVEEGGLQLIRVTDNGAGMDEEDCRLAFFRHATSKLSTNRDLFQIRSLGFRGEALPSIAAVAKVECVTAQDQGGLGRVLRIEGGKVLSSDEAPASKGTQIVVRDLFFNTPARLKYMKTIQTELSNISDYMYRLALSYPNIAFTLRHNENLLLQTQGRGDLLQVIASIYGTSAAKMMIPISAENPDYRLSGFVGKPELNRSNRYGLTTIINGRYIRSFGLSQAIQQAYHTLLPLHRYPLVILHLQMDPTLVDVNVHPAKLEVRFSKEQELYQFVEMSFRHVLQRQTLIPTPQKAVVKEHVVQERMPLYETSKVVQPTEESVQKQIFSEQVQAQQEATSANWTHSSASPTPSTPKAPSSATSATSSTQTPAATSPYSRAEKPPEHAVDMMKPAVQSSAPTYPQVSPVGQLHGTYIVAQNEDGIYLIDQHAAHERINYERFYELFGHPEEASQDLIVPITLEFTPSDASTLLQRLPAFARAGVQLEHFGGNSFIVRSYPHWLPAGEEQRIIEDMAEWILSEKQQVDIGKLREQAAIMCSCKSSIRANERLTIAEMESLLQRLAQCRNPFTCPHGRPITVSFSTYELEKMFKRVM